MKTYGRRKREEGTVFEGPSPSEIRVPDEALFRERLRSFRLETMGSDPVREFQKKGRLEPEEVDLLDTESVLEHPRLRDGTFATSAAPKSRMAKRSPRLYS